MQTALTVNRITSDTYTVPSQSRPGESWIVKVLDGNTTCDCPAGFYRGHCKHGRAVEEFLLNEQRAAYVATVDQSKIATLRALGLMK